MDYKTKLEMNKQNIHKAIDDYWAHTSLGTYIQNDISEDFICNLAEDNLRAKEGLRQMLRKSPAWNEELDALVINGNVTHDPDYDKIYRMAVRIVRPALGNADEELHSNIVAALDMFGSAEEAHNPSKTIIQAMDTVAPRAYAPGKKLSRVFKAFCVALGVADESPNSDFQRDFAKIADEMSSKKLDFKLFLSVNPAHFLTMSNPKNDDRGECLTSCHSFNTTEYTYNNGCTGYARDSVTMIAFTASNPNNPETLNNRKTTRQLFMYKPGNGLLLQSRMYNTSGGTEGAQKESELYRDLVQRQISLCENAVNQWVKNTKNKISLYPHDDFGGYPDWEYDNFNPIISYRKDCMETMQPFTIGAEGLCIACGETTSEGLYCEDCNDEDCFTCEHCGERCSTEESVTATDANGYEITICRDCANWHYTYCEDCDTYVYGEGVLVYDDYGNARTVCEECCEENYTRCESCGNYYQSTYSVIDRYGDTIEVCEECRDSDYSYCEDCEEYVYKNNTYYVKDECGDDKIVCEDCRDEYYAECAECDEWWPIDTLENGLCPDCLEKKEEEKEEKQIA